MPVKKDDPGRRYVPGTPEQVWQAIATGPGISSWFVPTEVEEREGGRSTADFDPGMVSEATLTEWDPPRRFAAESQDLGPDAPPVASERPGLPLPARLSLRRHGDERGHGERAAVAGVDRPALPRRRRGAQGLRLASSKGA